MTLRSSGEVIAALKHAHNRLIDLEDLPEEQVRQLEEHYRRLAGQVKKHREETGVCSEEDEEEGNAPPPKEKGPSRPASEVRA